MQIIVKNASVDTTPHGRKVIRGSIDPTSLANVLAGDYQREVLGGKSQVKLANAIKTSTVPDIELGARCKKFKQIGTSIIIEGPVYVIDGLQRISAAKQMIAGNEGGVPYIGAQIHMDTDPDWERERFRALNADRSKLSPNVLLRNSKHDFEGVALLYGMTTEMKDLTVYERVQWTQRPETKNLITANQLVRVACRIHAHMMPGLKGTVDLSTLEAFERLSELIGADTVMSNVNTFYDLINDLWGMRNLDRRDMATQMKGGFQFTLAAVLSDHVDFWKDDTLYFSSSLRTKLGTFKLSLHVSQLCQASTGTDLLYGMIVHHVNSGKRTQHLTLRPNEYTKSVRSMLDGDEGDAD